jgi:acyl-homoserine lactone acylase PvdQ
MIYGYARVSTDGAAWPGIVKGNACQLEGIAKARRQISTPASPPPLPNGSNAFAVSGAKTSSGRAIVANDMHLPLRVPNIWYRARLLVQQRGEDRVH